MAKKSTKKPFKVTVLTLFPEMFPGPLSDSVLGNALEKGLWELEAVDIRAFATDKHSTVDDRPFGGGSGMVMKPDVLSAAIESVLKKNPKRKTTIFYLSPRGTVFNQRVAEKMAALDHVVFLCGRYEGVDQRILDFYEIQELSLGDFVLSGGEIPAMAVIDTCVRLHSGVLGNADALAEESFGEGFYTGLLEYSHYTRPAVWRGLEVPKILLSGHHKDIQDWRQREAEEITRQRRKDLWLKHSRSKKLLPKKGQKINKSK